MVECTRTTPYFLHNRYSQMCTWVFIKQKVKKGSWHLVKIPKKSRIIFSVLNSDSRTITSNQQMIPHLIWSKQEPDYCWKYHNNLWVLSKWLLLWFTGFATPYLVFLTILEGSAHEHRSKLSDHHIISLCNQAQEKVRLFTDNCRSRPTYWQEYNHTLVRTRGPRRVLETSDYTQVDG